MHPPGSTGKGKKSTLFNQVPLSALFPCDMVSPGQDTSCSSVSMSTETASLLPPSQHTWLEWMAELCRHWAHTEMSLHPTWCARLGQPPELPQGNPPWADPWLGHEQRGKGSLLTLISPGDQNRQHGLVQSTWAQGKG